MSGLRCVTFQTMKIALIFTYPQNWVQNKGLSSCNQIHHRNFDSRNFKRSQNYVGIILNNQRALPEIEKISAKDIHASIVQLITVLHDLHICFIIFQYYIWHCRVLDGLYVIDIFESSKLLRQRRCPYLIISDLAFQILFH